MPEGGKPVEAAEVVAQTSTEDEVLEVELTPEEVKPSEEVVKPEETKPAEKEKAPSLEDYRGVQKRLQQTLKELEEAKKGSTFAESLKQEIGAQKATLKQILEMQKVTNDLVSGRITEEEAGKRYAQIDSEREAATLQVQVAAFVKAVTEAGLDIKDPALQKWADRYANPEAALEDLPGYVAKVKGKVLPTIPVVGGKANPSESEKPGDRANEPLDVKKLQADLEYWKKRASGQLDGEPGGPSAAGVNTDGMSPVELIAHGLTKMK